MQIIDVFSGIGGFSYAGKLMGWRTIQFCEIDKFCQKVLSYHWPGVPIHDNIKTLTAEQIKNNPLYNENETTIFVGGVPCQPWSVAGKRLGKADDRDLWEETIKLVGQVKPDWCLLENVRGLVNWSGGLVFEQVQADLEVEGYEVLPFILPACAVDAPHRRDRVWFVGKRIDSNTTNAGIESLREWAEQANSVRNAPHPDSAGLQEARPEQSTAGIAGVCTRAETPQNPLHSGRIQREPEQEGTEIREQRDTCSGSSERICVSEGTTSDTSNLGCNHGSNNREERHIQGNERITSESESERDGRISRFGEAGSVITDPNRNGFQRGIPTNINKQPSGERTYAQEHLSVYRQRVQFQNFPTQPPVCSGDDGISDRLDAITFSKWRQESIKAYGNAVVPPLVLEIFKAIEVYENLPSTD